ncbi:hypothetical protein [Actinoplanes nipponensis]|uniref:hypothetical protein n=1 Tax=Actinoplanes nipponensis TaxID=135950 RepID=UPI0031EC72F3
MRSQQPTPELIRAAVTATVDRSGRTRLRRAGRPGFGEHPDCALGRMQWARTAVRRAYAAA